jgi:predicted nucleotidyltransferase
MLLTTEMIIETLNKNLHYLHEKYSVKNIVLFCSWVTGQATPESDIDLIIEFDQPIGFQFIELCYELEQILGRRIDILTPTGLANIRINSVKKQIKQQIFYV